MSSLAIITLPVSPREQLSRLIDEANRRGLPTVDALTPEDQDELTFFDLVARLELLGPAYIERAFNLLKLRQVVAATAANFPGADPDVAF
jgi:hypothetical protein